MTAPRDWRGRALSVGLGALLILIVAELGLVIMYSQAPPRADVAPLAAGAIVEPMVLRTLTGEPQRLDFEAPETETVLLVFSTSCPACRANLENWERLREGPVAQGRRFYYVSISSQGPTRAFAERHGLTVPVLIGERGVLSELGLSRIPVTVAVGVGGLVRGVWVGEVPDEAF